MPSDAGSRASPPRVLIVQLWGVGDVIMSLPVAAAIREEHPDASVAWLVSSSSAVDVLRLAGEHDVTRLRSGARGWALLRALFALRARRFTAAVVGSRQSRGLAELVHRVAGIGRVLSDAPGWQGGPGRALEVTDPEHRVVSNLKVAGPLLRAVTIREPTLSPGARPRTRGGARLLGLHVGSEPATAQKRYPTERWREVVLRLLEEIGDLEVVVFLGPSETEDIRAFQGLHPRVRINTGKLDEVAREMQRCELVAGTDSGLGHLAAAVGVATLTIAGPSQIECYHPYSALNTIVRTRVPLPCQPCYGRPMYGRCRHRSCLMTIDTRTVIEAIKARLADSDAVRAPVGVTGAA